MSGTSHPMINGSALDIGGTRARLYYFEGAAVRNRSEISLPPRQGGEEEAAWGSRRVQAIADLVGEWAGPCPGGRIPTACAGRKDERRESVVLSFYASTLPDLVPLVKARTGRDLGPLLDDDVCAGWGHQAAGHLDESESGTIVLTAGTGVAESLWRDGAFLPKGSFPRLSDLGLEDALRAEAWRGGELPLEALARLVVARREQGEFSRLLLSGRFAQRDDWPATLEGVELQVRALDEAPALGALAQSPARGQATP